MRLAPKQVTCRCGHTFTSHRDRSWCDKCCEAVYYHEKDKIAIASTAFMLSA
jgi:uncharacterized paraquat-inducible protein A